MTRRPRLPRRVHRFAGDERGAAVVEFAIVVPVLLLLVLGIIDLGRMLAVAGSLTAAVRDGARMAAASASPSDAAQITAFKNRVITSFQTLGGPALQASNITVTDPTNNGIVTVTVSGYTYQPLTPLFRMIGAGTVTFTRTSTFRWERSSI